MATKRSILFHEWLRKVGGKRVVTAEITLDGVTAKREIEMDFTTPFAFGYAAGLNAGMREIEPHLHECNDADINQLLPNLADLEVK